MTDRVTVQVQQRTLSLSNLDKVMYPQTGFTKGEVIDYYTRIAPVLLPHLSGRPLTVKRYPNGVDAPFFYEKNAPKNTPDWVPTVRLPVPGSTKDRDSIDYLLVEELATVVWLANQAALELHVPQWHLIDGRAHTDVIVFDLDPGAPATVTECAQVALLLREHLTAAGLDPQVKTSGSKGLQVSAAISAPFGLSNGSALDPVDVSASSSSASGLADTSGWARELAVTIGAKHPDLVVWKMAKQERRGKVLIDWSQNNPAKTTVAPYSLRARAMPTVSTPVRWDEVAAHAHARGHQRRQQSGTGQLSFTSDEVLSRVQDFGDLFANTLVAPVRSPSSRKSH